MTGPWLRGVDGRGAMASQLGVVQWAKVEVWQLRVGGVYEVKFNEGLAPISAMTPGRVKEDGVSNTSSSSQPNSSAKMVFRKSSPYSIRPASRKTVAPEASTLGLRNCFTMYVSSPP